jgi:WD40 repeat protein
MGNGTETRVLKGHGNVVTSVAVSPDNKSIVSGSGDKTVRWVLPCQLHSASASCLTVLSHESDTMVLLHLACICRWHAHSLRHVGCMGDLKIRSIEGITGSIYSHMIHVT